MEKSDVLIMAELAFIEFTDTHIPEEALSKIDQNVLQIYRAAWTAGYLYAHAEQQVNRNKEI